uniref:RBR-type E3 ubiquitin transferase n=1 Tax=Rhizophora mucronata TaxID=61149 RepID=A0A2P2LT53_RHIMU
MRKARRGDSKQRHHVPEDRNFEALHHRPRDERQEAHSGPESPSSTATTSKQQNSHRKSPKSQRNPEWLLRKQRKHVYKQRFVEKSELSTPNSEVGSLNSDLSPSNSEAAPSNVEERSLSAPSGSLSFGEQLNVEMGKVKEDGLEIKKDEIDDAKKECEDGKGVDDAMTRLERLQSGVVEPELSEELLKINDQLQEDELLALESIYGDNAFVLDRQRHLRVFQIHIHIEAPGSFTITANLNSMGGLRMKSDGSHDFLYSFKLEYLPPIVLTCLLPKSYPSHLPPYFTISVQWLDSIRISSLCSMLDSIWMEQLGQEVIYRWAEWLHDFSLSFLGVVDEITLGPYGIKQTGDVRAISRSISPDVDICSLRNYNDQQCHENFQNNLHECCICYNEYAGSDFVRLPCEHFFCWKCMKTYSDIHVSEGTVNKLQCPDARCQGLLPPSLLKQLLGDKEYERWESLMLQKTLDAMSDVVYCPRCEMPCIEDEEQHAQCSKCFFSFCTLCQERRHVGTACLPPELKLQFLQVNVCVYICILFGPCILVGLPVMCEKIHIVQ